LIYLHTSQYDKSIENFTKVQELNPENVDSFIFHGQVLALKGDESNLFTLIDGLLAKDNLELTPSQYSTIQQMYYDFGKFEQIELLNTNFSEKIEINANAKLIYIDALIRLEKFNQADLIMKEITNIENLSLSEKAKLKSFEAITSYKLDRKQEGLDAIDEAEKIDNTVAIVHYIKGLILKDMGKTTEADISFERAVELDLQGNVTKLVNEK
jgi:tetratricopeptide (TPR) repeat protein